MNELNLALSLEAIEALAKGNELVFDVPDEAPAGKLRVVMRCDDEAVMTFRRRIETAMLNLLPVGSTFH